MSQNTKNTKALHRVTPAKSGTHCWCGADAVVTRTMPGVETSYCSRHWALWWELEMSAKYATGADVAVVATSA